MLFRSLKNVSTTGILDVEAYALDLIKVGFSVDCIPILHIQAKHCKSFAVLKMYISEQKSEKSDSDAYSEHILTNYCCHAYQLISTVAKHWVRVGEPRTSDLRSFTRL